ncbi:Plasmodium exported protein, unknown function [Plasmodium gonderi]|uniref:Variable surface protein n=1 Tax=Plasmodium gonderi TaxID=77519 RepID=A0A1Y1JPT7_PLAGO|nr:Plasmodium exported protein, unknown function [Plasmodium gonderi]GAW84636.1 Plasmodium exported protein, unknown function [Plasmodium gonderi]
MNSIKLYDIVKNFPKCEKKLNESVEHITILHGEKPSGWKKICIDNENNVSVEGLTLGSHGPKNICYQSMQYLANVNNVKDNPYLKISGCEYFYYWLYELLHKNNNAMVKFHDIQSLYDQLISIFENAPFVEKLNLCKPSVELIKEEDFQKIIEIYDIYNPIYENGRSPNKDEIFNELVNIVNKYYEKIYNEASKIRSQVVPCAPCHTNILVPITITFFFTTFGSWILQLIKGNENRLYYIDLERHIFHGSEEFDIIGRNSRHNILYN